MKGLTRLARPDWCTLGLIKRPVNKVEEQLKMISNFKVGLSHMYVKTEENRDFNMLKRTLQKQRTKKELADFN